MQSAPSTSTQAVEPELSRNLLDGLRTPLDALRASMESLCGEYGEADPRARVAHAALEEVLRLGRSVQEYAELSAPPVPDPLTCRPEEIAYSARFQLDSELRSRVVVAREQELPRLHVDGPLLARSLWRLLALTLERSTGEALLHVEHCESELRFTISGSLPHAERGGTLADADLRQELARRDIEAVGGALLIERRPGGGTRLRAHLPIARPSV